RSVRSRHSFPTRRSSDLLARHAFGSVHAVPGISLVVRVAGLDGGRDVGHRRVTQLAGDGEHLEFPGLVVLQDGERAGETGLDVADRKSTRLNSSHGSISY